MPRFLRLPLAFVVLVTFATALHAQTTPFTAEDMLKVSPVSVLDVTEDGRADCGNVRRPIDNESTDHRRYGDPTYLAPVRVTLEIVDARTGGTTSVQGAGQCARRVVVARRQPAGRSCSRRNAADADAFPTTTLYMWEPSKKSRDTE